MILIIQIFLIGIPTCYAYSYRNYINIVGSSTVYPFTTVVAERFGKLYSPLSKTPRVEATGTGGGFKLFCGGIGINYPDIVNASRKISKSEISYCISNGVTEIIELEIGLDGIVLASSIETPIKPITIQNLWLALAKMIPTHNGYLIINPFKTWKEINENLPNTNIEILGPPQTSGTRDFINEFIMKVSCKQYQSLANKFSSNCQLIRNDGAFIETGENDNLIINKLVTNPNTLGILSYSLLKDNLDKLRGWEINGIAPSDVNITSGIYPMIRPLFIYVKKAHLNKIPNLREFITYFVSNNNIGENGLLVQRGLIPLPAAQRATVVKIVDDLKIIPLQ